MFDFIRHLTLDNVGWMLAGASLLLLVVGIVHAVKFVFVPIVKEWAEELSERYKENHPNKG